MKTMLICCALALTLTLSASAAPTPTPTPTAAPAITMEDARLIALTHAGVAQEDAVFSQTQFEREDGLLTLDVEFFVGALEYDYEIDATTGQILSFDNDIEPLVPEATGGVVAEAITPQQALDLALAQAQLNADQVRVTKAETDLEHGRTVYEIEFVCEGIEYECEIDAASGRMLEWDMDRD